MHPQNTEIDSGAIFGPRCYWNFNIRGLYFRTNFHIECRFPAVRNHCHYLSANNPSYDHVSSFGCQSRFLYNKWSQGLSCRAMPDLNYISLIY